MNRSPIDLAGLGRLADANLASAWADLGGVMGAAVGSTGPVTLVATGIEMAFLNGAYATGPADEPDQVIADAIGYMAAHGVPWLLWVRERVDDALLEAGRRAGLRDAGGPPCMGLGSLDQMPPLPSELVVARVDDSDALEVARDLMARGFEMPAELVHLLMGEGMLTHPGMASVLASVDGVPVTVATVVVSGTTAGIYNVATPPEHRRRGYGAAITWAAIAEGARRGCDHAVLQASEMGAPVYRAMGFADLGRYVQLEGPPTGA